MCIVCACAHTRECVCVCVCVHARACFEFTSYNVHIRTVEG
jgi:hypothetical protein